MMPKLLSCVLLCSLQHVNSPNVLLCLFGLQRYKKAVIAVRDSKDAVSMAQQEISSMETACLHLKAECKAKEVRLPGC